MNETMYEQAVKELLEIPKFTKKNSFIHTQQLIAHLNCQMNQMKIIHVAGTNGKGSVCAYLQGILMEAGFRVGMFTSPHLVCINERFRLQGQPVANEVFTEAYFQVRKVVEEMQQQGYAHPTFFEYLMAMAIVLYSRQEVDYLILETGLGGRLDATNVIDHPVATVITSIGLDHTEYLGDTLEKIAGEKAGILKAGVPLIYDASISCVNTVLESRAQLQMCPAYPVTASLLQIHEITAKDIDFSFQCGYDRTICMKIQSCAEYQTINASLAVQTIQVIEPHLSVKTIQRGVFRVIWPGRMEWIRKDVLLDGAHNLAGMKEAVRGAAHLNKKIILLFSAVREKNYEQMIQCLCQQLPISEIIVTQLQMPRAADSHELEQIFQQYSKQPVRLKEKIEEALQLALHDQQQEAQTIVFATGSLYLIGELHRLLRNDQTTS